MRAAAASSSGDGGVSGGGGDSGSRGRPGRARDGRVRGVPKKRAETANVNVRCTAESERA